MTPAEKERAAVVAWLRGNSTAMYRHASDTSLAIRDRLESEIVAQRDRRLADAIERAEHLKEGR